MQKNILSPLVPMKFNFKTTNIRLKAFLTGFCAALGVTLFIFAGSQGLKHFDHALVWYAAVTILTVYAIGYRFTIWIHRPPTRMYFTRGLQILLGRNVPGVSHLNKPFLQMGSILVNKFLAQNFIRQRSTYRWMMHLFLAGGCALSFAVVFPLVFGIVHFEMDVTDPTIYHVIMMGIPVDKFPIDSLKGFVMFNMLNIGALLALIGLIMAGARRIFDKGERALQTFYEDILPLILIMNVTLTGIGLTVSYKFFNGLGHSLISWIHMVTVIVFMFYLPFGKLFHIFQRSGHLFVSLYQKAGETGEKALCHGCSTVFTSQMHVNDLKIVLGELGFNYQSQAPHGRHYADFCPACRRRMLVLSQEKHKTQKAVA